MSGGIPAFPRSGVYSPTTGGVEGGTRGMTLRDYFAAAILQGWAAGRNQPMVKYEEDSERGRVAKACYAYADAMLVERAKEVQP